ncbi:unnamed protein product [Protopolystoma xenopodis]|uniref:Uncharacterized protein n=1 Tax=Protopolystoma xenopodis TaxID=117903 RepID=A0A448X4X6_9PLAT|nr:unnamed protein product [Protopolystoma xenopodis]
MILPTEESRSRAYAIAQSPKTVQMGSLGMFPAGTDTAWKPGELEFEAMMRRLDAAGYRTGYFYRLTQLRHAIAGGTSTMTPREAAAHTRRSASLGRGIRAPRDDVEIPPAASSFATSFYEDEETRAAAAISAKAKTLSLQRTHWCNTPNQYTKKGMTSPGMLSPAYGGVSFTQWEPLGGSPIGASQPPELFKRKSDSLRIMGKERATLTTLGGGTSAGIALPILDRNQFAPQGENPRELKEQQKRVNKQTNICDFILFILYEDASARGLMIGLTRSREMLSLGL